MSRIEEILTGIRPLSSNSPRFRGLYRRWYARLSTTSSCWWRNWIRAARDIHLRRGYRARKLPQYRLNRQAVSEVRRQIVNFLFRNRRIQGVLAVVPANQRSFVDEMANFNFPASPAH